MVIGGADYQFGMIHVVDKQNKICPMADKSMSVVVVLIILSLISFVAFDNAGVPNPATWTILCSC